MRNYVLFGLVAAVVMLSGCASTQQAVKPAPTADEVMVWSSYDQRPAWTVTEPDTEGDKLIFIGLSGKYATEKDARDDAQVSAIKNVVKYIGTMAQTKLERLQTSSGLTSDILSPTDVTRSLENQLSQAFATRVKPQEWYIEKWQNKLKESYYLVFVKAGVPQSVIDSAYKETLNGAIDDLKKKRDAASEEKAKKQFENAMDAFKTAKEQGFTFEK